MAKKYSKSKSPARRASGGKKKAGSTGRKPAAASRKKLAMFKALYMGAKPEADLPENLTRNPSERTSRR